MVESLEGMRANNAHRYARSILGGSEDFSESMGPGYLPRGLEHKLGLESPKERNSRSAYALGVAAATAIATGATDAYGDTIYSFADFFAGPGSTISTTSASDYFTIGGLEPSLGMKISLGIFDSTGSLVGYGNNPLKDFPTFTGSVLGSYDGVGVSLQGWADCNGDGNMGNNDTGPLIIDEDDCYWFSNQISYNGGPLGDFTGLSVDLAAGILEQTNFPALAPVPIPQPSSGILLALGLVYLGARQIMKKRR